MLQHVLWRGSTRIIKDAAPAWLVLRTSGTAATWIYIYVVLHHVHHVHVVHIQVAAVPLVCNTSRAGAASLMLRVLPRQSTCCNMVYKRIVNIVNCEHCEL